MNSLPSFRVSRRIPEQGIDFICKMYDVKMFSEKMQNFSETNKAKIR